MLPVGTRMVSKPNSCLIQLDYSNRSISFSAFSRSLCLFAVSIGE